MLRRLLPALALTLALCGAALAGGKTASPGTGIASGAPEQSFQQIEVMAEQDNPSACLVFAASIDEAQRDTLSSLVTVTPADDVALKLNDTRICLEGLSFGQHYQVTVKPGLTGNSLAPTTKPIEQAFDVPNRTPALAFRSSGYVLPRIGAEGIPLRTINVSEAGVSIYRINDRNLIDRISRSMIGDQMPQYSVDTIANTEGEKVYSGTLSIKRENNQWVNTLIPVAEAIKERKPGVYIAVAGNADKDAPAQNIWSDKATQWFVISDLAVSAFTSPNDGIAVVTRSLNNGAPLRNISLTLLATNNTELGSVSTDARGIARFAPGLLRGEGGNAARAIYAYDQNSGDFTFLDLGTALDLTDRGVAGRYASGPMDAYVVTERGIYRPGEMVYATALLRDASLKAITGTPLTLKVLRPDGKEAETRSVTEVADGGYSFTWQSNVNDQSGTWTLQLFTDPKLSPVGSTTFQLEDFQPPRLELDLKPGSAAINADGTGQVLADGRFLYGAPAAGLTGQAVVSLKYADQPYEAYKGWSFGQVQEKFLPVRAELPGFLTGEDGKATLDLALGQLPDTSHPLQADVNVTLFDVGGRPVTESVTLPVHNLTDVIGVHPQASSFAENSEAVFDVALLDATTGTPKAAEGLSWQLYKEEYDYVWYRSGYGWNYEPTIRGQRVGEGKFDVTTAHDSPLRVSVASGYYRLELHGADDKTVTSIRFNAGWRANPAAPDKPDAVTITRNETSVVKPGADVTFNIKPPYDAEATLISADSRLRDITTQPIPAAGGDVTLKVPADAAGGFYLLVSAVQKNSGNRNTPSRRAMGVLWVPLDPAPNKLDLTLTAPELARPNTTVNVDVSAAGMGSQNVHVVLAAVDDGVLGLTDYKSPNPSDWFLGQRWLSIMSYDVYGNLIDSSNATRGELREGGDTDLSRQMKGLPQQITKIAALYSGIVEMHDGKASIPLNLPDFNGRLRLMAFAWTSTRTGQTDAQMTVRAPLVADLLLPRFLAPGDKADIQLSVDNRDAPAGDYSVKLTPSGPATLEGGQSTLTLAAGQRKALPMQLSATTIGDVGFDLEIKGPQDYSLTRHFNISVRSGNPTQTRRIVSMLASGQENTIKPDLLEGLLPGTEEMSVSYSPLPAFDVPDLLKKLYRYPYGCAEQTTSTALPLLYVNKVASSLGLGQDAALHGRIQNAIDKLTAMQRKDGGMGLWSSASDYDIWLTAYVADFLSRAQKENYRVPSATLANMLARLSETMKDSYVSDRDIAVRAYAVYILARNGSIDAADVRYFYDTWFKALPSRLSRTQVAAALKLVGDEVRSAAALAKVDGPRAFKANYVFDYGSDLRDDAARLVLISENHLADTAQIVHLAENIAQQQNNSYWLSTQEMSWMLLAANALLGEGPADMHLTVGSDAVVQKQPYYRNISASSPALTVKNNGEKDVFQIVTMSGVPLAPQPAEDNGFTLSRSYYRPDGTPISLDDVKQNDLVVVMLLGNTSDTFAQQAIVADLLPAGFEIENTRINGSGESLGNLSWLGDNVDMPEQTEFRADRYVAAINLGELYYSRQSFRIAYIMRAVTPGTFTVPGSYVEDMYNPARFARGASGTATIRAAQ